MLMKNFDEDENDHKELDEDENDHDESDYKELDEDENDDEELDEDFYVSNDTVASGDFSSLLNEIRHTYDIDSPINIHCYSENTEGDREAWDPFEDSTVTNYLNDANADSKKSCASCSKPVRVDNVLSLRRGQHIAMPGKKFRKYLKYNRKLIHTYKHHAIIKEIKRTSGTRIEMEVIHFTNEGKKIKIYQSANTYDLINDELYIIEYLHPRYSADEIVRRAENVLQEQNNGQNAFKEYNVFTNNCEHFATWCVCDEKISFQCQRMHKRLANLVQRVFDVGSEVSKMIIRILRLSSEQIATSLMDLIPEIVSGPAVGVYLIYSILTSLLYWKKYRAGHLCLACFKRELQALWINFSIFGTTSLVTFLFMIFALPLLANPIGIPLTIILILLSVAIQWSVPKLIKALRSPFSVDKIKIHKLSEIEVGDVVLIKYYKIEHVIIVTEVHDEDDASRKGRIRGVHYGLPSFFGTREVMEEQFSINLNQSVVKAFDCSNLVTNPPRKAVKLARKRVGETKWALTSNRSDHLCFWAKIKQTPRGFSDNNDLEGSSTKDFSSLNVDTSDNSDNNDLEASSTTYLSSMYVDTIEIHLMNDLHKGEVIKYQKKIGILVQKETLDCDKGRLFKIEMIFYDSERYFRRNTYTVDLNKDRIFVKHYHPAHCHPLEVRKDRANRLEGTKGTWWTNTGFIKHCILLHP